MANYYKQCECKRMTDKVPCYECLEEENKRLREALEKIRDAKPVIRNTISEFSGTPAFYYVPPAPAKLQEIARQALEGGND